MRVLSDYGDGKSDGNDEEWQVKRRREKTECMFLKIVDFQFGSTSCRGSSIE